MSTAEILNQIEILKQLVIKLTALLQILLASQVPAVGTPTLPNPQPIQESVQQNEIPDYWFYRREFQKVTDYQLEECLKDLQGRYGRTDMPDAAYQDCISPMNGKHKLPGQMRAYEELKKMEGN